jgi:hypothetical protein
MNENMKTIQYLINSEGIKLQEKNALGQTPEDLALLIPKKSLAMKIKGYIELKIRGDLIGGAIQLAP